MPCHSMPRAMQLCPAAPLPFFRGVAHDDGLAGGKFISLALLAGSSKSHRVELLAPTWVRRTTRFAGRNRVSWGDRRMYGTSSSHTNPDPVQEPNTESDPLSISPTTSPAPKHGDRGKSSLGKREPNPQAPSEITNPTSSLAAEGRSHSSEDRRMDSTQRRTLRSLRFAATAFAFQRSAEVEVPGSKKADLYRGTNGWKKSSSVRSCTPLASSFPLQAGLREK
ncbi:hypothetical protein BJ875DRAFT_522783 [Amylocarpus encephaloides]|uniref:Uncharacterized protein n=1 Tax=Amylocarpus encephaloides TaxID=45428 RepID=A0A9P7YUD4_9HELO|nr:hypothetical protein BJ875DRAFT_522783 [Amylocarpus encephaloides]